VNRVGTLGNLEELSITELSQRRERVTNSPTQRKFGVYYVPPNRGENILLEDLNGTKIQFPYDPDKHSLLKSGKVVLIQYDKKGNPLEILYDPAIQLQF